MKVQRLALVSMMVPLAIAACESATTEPEHLSVELTSVPIARGPSAAADYDQRLAELADDLPGFGGYFREGGRLVVLLQENTSSLETAKAIIADFRSRSVSRSDVAERRRAEVSAMIARHADFNFRELYDWYGQLQRPVWGVDGVSWTDIDERTNRIEVGVTREDVVARVTEAIAHLSIPTEAVHVVYDPGEFVPDASLQDASSPRRGGVQVSVGGLSDACSLGFHVDRPEDAYWYFVTASHCSSDYASVDGDDIGQPLVGTKIGYEVYDPDPFTNATDTLCAASMLCRRSDAALFRHTSWDFLHGYLAWPNIGSTSFTVGTQVLIAYDAEVGDTVHMVGRTSGRQKGVVTDTCVKRTGPYSGYQLLCVWEANYTSGGGDSGGPVVWVDPLDPDFKVAVGIHSGTSTTGSRVFSATSQWKYEMQQEYGGTYCVDRFCAPDPTVSIVEGPTVVPNTFMWCEWKASSNQGIPPYSYTWSGVASGSGSTLNAPVSGEGFLFVEVEDGNGNTDTDAIYITIDSGVDPPECSW